MSFKWRFYQFLKSFIIAKCILLQAWLYHLFYSGPFTRVKCNTTSSISEHFEWAFLFSKILYAHLLIEEAFRSPASAKNSAKEAISLLKSIADHLKDEPFYWRLRASALGLAGFNAEADLALAEETLLQGDIKQATNKTKKALKSSPQIREKAKDKAKDIEASRSTAGS